MPDTDAPAADPRVKFRFTIVERPTKFLGQDRTIVARKIHESYNLPTVPVLKTRSDKISGRIDNEAFAYGVAICAEQDPDSPLDRDSLFFAMHRYLHVVQIKYKAN